MILSYVASANQMYRYSKLVGDVDAYELAFVLAFPLLFAPELVGVPNVFALCS